MPPAAAAWVVVDVATGAVLAAHDDRRPLPPASLTKVLTALVATGWLPPTARLPITAAAATVYPDRVGMKAGQVWSLVLALHALLIFSANDAAYAIAQRVSGTLPSFGSVMTAAAREMGMADHPVLHDPAGLDGTEGVAGGNLMSARDLAIAGRDLLAQPTLARIVALRHFPFEGPDGVAYDIETKDLAFLDAEPGAIGVKTGFTDRAGSCLMGAATQGNRTLMAVVLNGTNPTLTARVLLAQGFAAPVAAEPVADTLPPPVAPHPLPPPPPMVTAVGQPAVGQPAVGHPVTAHPVTAHPVAARPVGGRQSVPGRWWSALAAAALAVVVVGLLLARRRRERPINRRRRPGAGWSPRR